MCAVPVVPAHQGGARAARATPSPAAAVAAGWCDWIGLDRRAADGFDMIQNRVDQLAGMAQAVRTHSTATATDAAVTIRDTCLRSGGTFPTRS